MNLSASWLPSALSAVKNTKVHLEGRVTVSLASVWIEVHIIYVTGYDGGTEEVAVVTWYEVIEENRAHSEEGLEDSVKESGFILKAVENPLKWSLGTSWAAQWLRLRFPMQGVGVQSLVREPRTPHASWPVNQNTEKKKKRK